MKSEKVFQIYYEGNIQITETIPWEYMENFQASGI